MYLSTFGAAQESRSGRRCSLKRASCSSLRRQRLKCLSTYCWMTFGASKVPSLDLTSSAGSKQGRPERPASPVSCASRQAPEYPPVPPRSSHSEDRYPPVHQNRLLRPFFRALRCGQRWTRLMRLAVRGSERARLMRLTAHGAERVRLMRLTTRAWLDPW